MTWTDFFLVYFTPLKEPKGGYVISCQTEDWNGKKGPLPGYYTSRHRAEEDAKLMFDDLQRRIDAQLGIED